MTNRFLTPARPTERTPSRLGANGSSTSRPASRPWSTPLATTDATLVVLLENGGVDLGIPALVDRLIDLVPGGAMLPSDLRQRLVEAVRSAVVGATDAALETAELILNRYQAARPQHFDDVVVLRDSTASAEDLRRTLFSLTRAAKVADLVILTHGTTDHISVTGGIDTATIRAMRTELGQPLRLRAVYMMNCVGSSLNQAWLDAGAMVSAGSTGNNYLPEPTTHFFWEAWKAGQPFETAATSAYRRTVALLNDTVRGVVSALPVPGSSALAGALDVAQLDFVQSSAPIVAGRGQTTITSDYAAATAAAHSVATSLMTTVVPASSFGRPRYPAASIGAAAAMSQAPGVNGGRPAGRHALELVRSYDPQASPASVEEAARIVDELVLVPLADHERDALTSFTQQLTAPRLRSSTVLRLLNGGSKDQVPAEMRRWVRVRRDGRVVDSPTLVRRRATEAELFERGATSGHQTVEAARALSAYSYAQNPGFVIAGIAVADAIQIGLGAVAVGQAAMQSVQGGWSLTYPSVERLLTPEARAAMPGSQSTKQTFRRNLFEISIGRWGTANANVIIEWEGNPYGEMGTVRIERDLPTSSEWSRSTCSISMNRLQRIPAPGSDPRTWPIVFSYTGAFDPFGNGHYEFTGEFEIDAFGRLHFHRHVVVSRSFADWMLGDPPERCVQRGRDVAAPVPEIPAEQLAYLRTRLPA